MTRIMKCFATSFAVAAVSVMPLGCIFPEQCIGDCEPDGDGTTTTAAPGSTDTSETLSGSQSSAADSSSTGMADDESSSSSGSAPTACGGSPLALCLPATEQEEAFCLCPVESLGTDLTAEAIDLDGDGLDDLLLWEWGGEQLLPFLTTAGGLAPLDPEPSPLPLRPTSFYEQDDGAARFLVRPSEGVPEVGRYVPGEGIDYEPVMATQISEFADLWSQTLADFDGDGALDLVETWAVLRGEQTVGVLFDVLGSPSPASWSAPVDVPPLYVSVKPCPLDDDGADDVLIKATYGEGFPLHGLPMQPSVVLGEGIPIPEGGATCRDLDTDGDMDILATHGCYDCTPYFGGYSVLEQTSPGEFTTISTVPHFDDELLGGSTVLAHLTDPTTPDVLSLGPDGVLFGPLGSNFGLRRTTAPMQWDEGRYTEVEGLWAFFVVAVDSDHDGLEELVLQIKEDEEDETRTTYLYRVEPMP